MEALSLYELNNLVRRHLEEALPDAFWVRAELGEVRLNRSGHCYVEFVEKDPHGNGLVARAKGNIWANVFTLLKPYFEAETGQAFTAGIKVLVQVSVHFHELYGFSLTVHDIDPTYTLGDLARRRKEILAQLEAEGVLTLNKELPMPCLPRRVAVVSSPTAAGYGDFCDQLRHNARGFAFHVELFPALMQGEQTERSILSALDAINARQDDFDVVVIIRGGGAVADLSGFDTYLLAAACAQFPLPVITGIGHERDDTVLDLVAHTRVKTPTAAAEFLIACMEESARRLEQLTVRLQEAVRSLLQRERLRLQTCRYRLCASAPGRIATARVRLAGLRKELAGASASTIERQRHGLALLRQRLVDLSPEKQFARGYSLTLKGGKAVKEAAALQEGDLLVTRFFKGEITSTVKSIK